MICVVCGCTDEFVEGCWDAAEEECFWVQDDLCSTCDSEEPCPGWRPELVA